MSKQAGIVIKTVETLGFIFGDGAKCQLAFFEPKKPEILEADKK